MSEQKARKREGEISRSDLPAELLIKHFGSVAHASRIHSVHNRAIARLLDWLVSDLNSCAATRHEARIELDGGYPFLNGAPVRASRELRVHLSLFSEVLRARVCGGFRMKGPATRGNLASFFDGIRAGPSDRPVFQDWLKSHGAAEIELLPPRRLVSGVVTGSGQSVRVASSEALRGYVKTVTSLETALKTMNLEKIPSSLYRAVQNLVDLAIDEPDHHLALTSIKEDTPEETRHPIHVAILSMALGQRLGMERNLLVELGFSAIMAGALASGRSDQERLQASARLVQVGKMTGPRARRMLTVYEHGLARATDSHLFSRIVAIAVGFDRLSNPVSGLPLLPDEILARMQADSGYDPELVKIFTLVVGRYPLGSPVRLNTGEIGIVYHSPPDASKANRPVLKLVRDAAGRSISRIVDLSQDQRQIVGMVDQELVGFNLEFFQ